ncbi:FtsH protease activity modulator HflK [Candidatus Foliamicus sp.]
MAWNEPGGGNGSWNRGGRQQPDLEDALRDTLQKVFGAFGGKGGRSARRGLTWLVLGALALWAFTGLYRVDEAERAVVLRFGEYASTRGAGLRWHLPWPIESVEKVNVAEVNKFSQQTRMLTADENIVVVDLVVQYQRSDPVDFLFQVRQAEETLGDVSESAIREIIGKNEMDYILGEGRGDIAQRTEDLIQQTLDDYRAGIGVTQVNLRDANYPQQVEAAVQDAIKAREDKERLAFEAQAYANDVVPRARGEAAKRLQDAEGYKAQVVADAEGEAQRFEKLLVEYAKAPQVTRERLYIEALEDFYGGANKVLLEAEGSGNLLYLPVDQLMKRSASGQSSGGGSGQGSAAPRSGGSSRGGSGS